MTASAEHKTCCHRVLEILVDAIRRNLRWNLQQDPQKPAEYAPPGYLPIWAFQGPSAEGQGGSAGDVRLRQLRNQFGIPIQKIIHRWETDPKRRTWLYALGCEPETVDLERICLKNIKIDPVTKQAEMVL